MARVKHTLQNGVVHLRQQNSGKLAAIDVSLYEYINEEDKPNDEYVFRNGGSSTFNFSASGNTETSTITSQYGHEGSWSNVPFSCTEKPEWVTVNTTATSVSVRANENTETSIRAGSVVLTQDTSNKKITIAVSQAAAESVEPEDPYVFTSDKYSVSGGHGEYAETITITSTYNSEHQNWRITSSADDWVRVVDGEGQTNLKIEFSDNHAEGESTEARDTDMTLTQEGSHKTITISFHQDGDNWEEHVETTYYLDVDPHSVHVTWAAGGDKDVKIDSYKMVDGDKIEVPYESTFYQNLEDWCHPNLTGKSGTFVFNCDNNETGEQRTGAVMVKQTEGQEPRKSVTVGVTQDAKEEEDTWELSMTPNPATHNAKSGDVTVFVTSTKNGEKHPWHIDIQAQVDWVTAKENTDDITLTFQENNQTEQRSTTLSITQDDSNKNAILNITQDAPAYVFTISPAEAVHNNAAGSVDVTVTSTKDGVEQPWSIFNNPDYEWSSVSEGDGKVTVTFEANSEHNERRDNATVQQEGSNNQRTISIKQSAADDVYVFDAESTMITVDPEGETKTITVNSKLNNVDHEWDITTRPDSWCTVTKEGPGLKIVISSNKEDKENTQERSTKVVITQNDSNRTLTINITQKGYTPGTVTYTFVTAGNSNISLPATNVDGYKITIISYKTSSTTGKTNVDYTCSQTEPWLIVSKEDDGVKISAQDNNVGSQRSGHVVLHQSEHLADEAVKSLTINVTQLPNSGL